MAVEGLLEFSLSAVAAPQSTACFMNEFFELDAHFFLVVNGRNWLPSCYSQPPPSSPAPSRTPAPTATSIVVGIFLYFLGFFLSFYFFFLCAEFFVLNLKFTTQFSVGFYFWHSFWPIFFFFLVAFFRFVSFIVAR